MAIQSQGVLIRRESTAAGTTALSVSANIKFDSTAQTILGTNATSNFVTDGWTSSMRMDSNASLNGGAYTVKSVAATVMTVYETLIAQATGATITLSGHTMANIGEVVSFNGPNLTANVIDITNLQSTAKEKLIGLQDMGQVSISVNFDTTDGDLHLSLKGDCAARTKRHFDILFTDTGTSLPSGIAFEGYVNGFALSGGVDNVMKGDITFVISTGIKWLPKV